jgi:hypothetical protein
VHHTKSKAPHTTEHSSTQPQHLGITDQQQNKKKEEEAQANFQQILAWSVLYLYQIKF